MAEWKKFWSGIWGEHPGSATHPVPYGTTTRQPYSFN